MQVLVYSFCMQFEFSFPTFLLIAWVISFFNMDVIQSLQFSLLCIVTWTETAKLSRAKNGHFRLFCVSGILGCMFNVWESGMLYWHHTDSVRHINEHLCINCIDYTSHMFLSSEKSALFTVQLKTSCSYWDGLYAAAHVWQLLFLLTNFN